MSTPRFTDAQKAILPLTVLIPLVGGWLARRWYRSLQFESEDHQRKTLTAALGVLSTATSGILFGQFFFHVFPRVLNIVGGESSYAINALFILLGYLPIVWIQKLWKLFRINPNHDWIDSQASAIDITDLLAVETNEVADFTLLNPQEMEEYGPKHYEATEELKRRRLYAMIVYCVLFFQSFFDGLWLLWNQFDQNPGILVTMFYFNKVLETLAVFTILLWAAAPLRMYLVAVIVFALVSVGGSAVFPMLPYIDAAFVAQIVQHIALRLVLGVSGGILFFVSVYFLFMDAVHRTEHKKAVGLLFVFTVSICSSWVTGYFM